MSPSGTSLAVLALAWLAWFALHSLTASLRVKAVAMRCPALSRRYRLLYNVVAVATLAGPGMALHAASGPPLFEPPRLVNLALDGLAVLVLIGFVLSSRGYQLGRFAGFGNGSALTDGASLRLRGLSRVVRHPWYSLALILVWTRPMDAAWLLSAVALSGYLVVGAWLEERKLVVEFGEAYRRYQTRVPMFVPWPGRRLTPAEAGELEALAAR